MRSLKWTLLIYILAGVLIVVLLSGFAVFTIVQSYFQTQLDQTLIDRANTRASLVSEENDGSLELEYDLPMNDKSIGVLVRITDDTGEIVAISDNWPEYYHAPRTPSTDQPVYTYLHFNGQHTGRVIAILRHASRDPNALLGGGHGISNRTVTVEVIGRLDSVQHAESAVLIALILGGAFAIFCSSLVVWFGIRFGLAPIRQLGSAVDQIDTQQLTLPDQAKPYPNELQPIVSALDGLLDRLRGAMERERRFTDAAAHELRTPIAELKTITDVADRFPDPERLHRSIKDAQIIVRQIEDLLQNLLAVARGETTIDSQAIESVQLLALTHSIVDETTNRIQRNNITWECGGDESATWQGANGIITALLRNLIENAAEYTPDNGTVRISVISQDANIIFQIENGPTLIKPTDVDKIFEPFWRSEVSRSDRNHQGLGLAIVDNLAPTLNIKREIKITEDQHLQIRFVQQHTTDTPKILNHE